MTGGIRLLEKDEKVSCHIHASTLRSKVISKRTDHSELENKSEENGTGAICLHGPRLKLCDRLWNVEGEIRRASRLDRPLKQKIVQGERSNP